MPQPTLCMIHNTIGDQSSIAKIAMWSVQQALNAGWDVTVVAHDLDKSLREDVKWLHLYVPPKAFLYQWLMAHATVKAAIGNHTFDVTHVYQAQVAAIADVIHCQFLTRAAYERHCLEQRKGLRHFATRLQQRGVLYAEDYYYHHWNDETHMLFCSKLTQNDFHRFYGKPAKESILSNACPDVSFPSDDERRNARHQLVGDHCGPVLGYLGGIDERKGYRQTIRALEHDKDIFLLMGGPGSEGFEAPSLGNRFRSIGLTHDLKTFFAACDVFIVPSYFDPCPLVVFEAAANGLPVIATNGVGNLQSLLDYGAGMAWSFDEKLAPLIYRGIKQRKMFNQGATLMASGLSELHQGQELLSIYNSVLREKQIRDGKHF